MTDGWFERCVIDLFSVHPEMISIDIFQHMEELWDALAKIERHEAGPFCRGGFGQYGWCHLVRH